jgi:acyl-CoA thioester hydrolase
MKAELELFIRYSEVDKLGIVYYSRYLEYFEVGRSAWLSKFMVNYVVLEDSYKIGLPVIECCVKYKNPAKYGDKLIITTQADISKISSVIVFNYVIKKEGEVLVEGFTRHIYYSFLSKRAIRLPEELSKRIGL